jgi:hypothetical protein
MTVENIEENGKKGWKILPSNDEESELAQVTVTILNGYKNLDHFVDALREIRSLEDKTKTISSP